MKIGPRELIVFVLLLGFLAGSYVLGFRRLGAERAFYESDIARKRTTLTALVQHAASVDELEGQLAELHQSIDQFEHRLPRQSQVEKTLEDVWELGLRNALRRGSVRPLKAERAGAASEQPLELTFEGEFPGLLAFLRDLEASDRIVRVTQLELSKPNAGSPSAANLRQPMSAKLTLNVYYEPDATVTR